MEKLKILLKSLVKKKKKICVELFETREVNVKKFNKILNARLLIHESFGKKYIKFYKKFLENWRLFENLG